MSSTCCVDEILGNAKEFGCSLRKLSSEDLSIIIQKVNKLDLRGTGYHWKVYRGKIVEKRQGGCDDQEPEILEVTVKIWDDPVDEDFSYFQDELRLLTNPSMRTKSMMAELFGYCYEDNTLALVYKLASMRTLEGKLHDAKFTWRMRLKVAIKIASGLAFLHSQDPPFIIRNLEPRHIMLDKNFNPKLFDFGLGSGWIFGDRTDAFPHVFGSDDYNKFHLQHHGVWSTKCDVFDFGIILLAMLTMETVPADKTIHDVYFECDKPYLSLGLFGYDGVGLVDLEEVAHVSSKCVELSPEKRPTIIEVATYLKGLHFALKSAWLERGMRHPARMYLDFPEFKHPSSLSSEDLKLLTNNFSKSNFLDNVNALGIVNQGKVYRGSNKCLNREGTQEVTVRIWEPELFAPVFFKEELRFLTLPSMSSHPNLVRLIGYCYEKQVLGLVYDLASSCTLGSILCDHENFSWAHRMKAALGIARALEFLHGQDPPFLQRNLDPAHVMLDKDFNPRIYEFGVGSGGILGDRVTFDPLYYGSFGLDDPAYYDLPWNCSSDVFMYGLLLLALISCRKVSSLDRSEVCVHNMIHGEKKCGIVVHEGLERTTGYDLKIAIEVKSLALQCVEIKDVHLRPSMKKVVSFFERLAFTPECVEALKVEPASVTMSEECVEALKVESASVTMLEECVEAFKVEPASVTMSEECVEAFKVEPGCAMLEVM